MAGFSEVPRSVLAACLLQMPDPPERLLRRVEAEARTFANSDGSMSQLRLGRVYGLLEAGVIAGYWRRRDSEAAASLVEHPFRLSKLPRGGLGEPDCGSDRISKRGPKLIGATVADGAEGGDRQKRTRAEVYCNR